MLLFLAVFCFRLLNAASIQTFFQPDEFYQALEPAHRLVFGYGSLTWEWRMALRSSVHPLIYAALYKLGLVIFSDQIAIIWAPRVAGATIAASADLYVYKFARKYWQSEAIARWALMLSLASCWNWYTSTRSFLNNLEMALTAAGLAYWPWHHFRLSSLLRACIFGFLSCIVRPTNALLWAPLGLCLVLRNMRNGPRVIRLTVVLLVLLALVLAISALADRFFYGEWTFPSYNFLEFNVVRNLLLFYGLAPWHFYLTQGLPLMLMGYIPLAILGACRHSDTLLVRLVLFVALAFSAIAHKEFRFLQPLQPAMLAVCAEQLFQVRRKTIFKAWMCFVVVLHVCVGYFFTRIHERGEIAVIEHLRDTPLVTSIGVLAPCHSFPWQSVLHRPELEQNSWHLTCEPPLHLAGATAREISDYRDQLDEFFDDPKGFWAKGTFLRPSHVIIFEPIEHIVKDLLGDYVECARFFNGYFHWDPRREGLVIVLCREGHENKGDEIEESIKRN